MVRPYGRELYLEEAVRYVPKLVTLLDTNPYRPTYGCFDREYWHYRTADFPSAMHQASVLPLALFYQTPHPRNPLYQSPRVREWVLAAMAFARRSSHGDGSGDDYYPFERALGATAFSLLAMTEAYQRLGFADDGLLRFFRRRADWIWSHSEPGGISNHQALAALCLYNVFAITRDDKYRERCRSRIQALLASLTPEGWFVEYDGCDPGYNTWTIDFLARYYLKSNDESVWPALRSAVAFTQYFLHPDGSIGGVYASRDSFNFSPVGFELLAPRMSDAAWVANAFLKSLAGGRHARFDDDRVFQHHLEQYLLAFHAYSVGASLSAGPGESFQRYFPQAGLLAQRKGEHYLVMSLKRGGAFRLFKGEQCVRTEAGYIAKVRGGGTIVSNLVDDDRSVHVDGNQARISGHFHEARFRYASPFKLILFRLLLLATGFSALASRGVKALLQRALVLRKVRAPVRFERTFSFEAGLRVHDRIALGDGVELADLSLGSDIATKYTAIGEVFEPSRLERWTSLSAQLPLLSERREIELKREFL
ncbi:MAG: hypothetical protein L0Z55_11955 [Planctomycetes bacterium]|nr:hypothetical protein [Planctomycetota bacterium]